MAPSRPVFTALLAAFGLSCLVALPHCASGGAPKRAGAADTDDGSGDFEDRTPSSAPSSDYSSSSYEPAPASPVDAGALAAAPGVDAGCTDSAQCAPVTCACKNGMSFDARLCVANACGAAKDVCPNACGFAGGWAGP